MKKDSDNLRESGALFHTLFESMREIVVIHEIITTRDGTPDDYRVIDCNEAYTQVTGIPREKASGALASDLYGTGVAPYLDIYAKVAAGGGCASFETYFAPMDKQFSITAVSHKPGFFITIATVIPDKYNSLYGSHFQKSNLITMFEALEDGAYISDRDFNILYANPALVKDFGPYESRKCYEYFHAGSEPCQWCKNDEVWAGRNVRWEWKSELNGRTYDLIGAPLHAPGGNAYKMEIFHDISDRKRAEELLQKELERTETLLKLNDMVSSFSDKALYDFALDHAVKLTGSEVGFFHLISEDQKFVSLVTWNDGALKTCAASYDSHYPLEVAGNWVDCVRLMRPVVYNDFPNSPNQKGLPDGHAPVRRFMSIPVIEDGKVRIIFGVGNKKDNYDDLDVARLQIVANELHKLMKQRRSEAALLEAFDLNHRILTSALLGILAYRADTGECVMSNQAAADAVDATIDKMLTQNFRNIDSWKISGLLPAAEKAISTGKDQRLAVNVTTSFGKKVELDCIFTTFENAGQKHLLLMIDDITGRRQAEEEVLKLRKIESVGVLAGGIAHDFNNHLTAILGNIDYAALVMKEDMDDALESLESAKAACLESRGLTRQLLTFSKGGAPVTKPGAVGSLLKDTVSFSLRGSKSKCEFEIPEDLWEAKMDAGQISQVIQNVALNADQAMPGGGVIKAAAENFELLDGSPLPLLPGKYIKVTISDTGQGVLKENIGKIFDPYFTTKDMGHGLGLATAFSIIKRHKGYIFAESEPGSGAEFTFYLPAIEHKTHAAPAPARPAAVSGVRALVMDDQPDITRLLKRRFEKSGCFAATAADGAEALRLYSEALASGSPFDVVILDLTIPGGMGGLETIKKLLEIDPSVNAIVASGYNSGPVMAEYEKHGFKGVAHKPFSFESLSKTIVEILGIKAP